MNTYRERHRRSLIKALSWRCCATFTTMLIVFAFTQKVVLSIEVGFVEVVTKLILYYVHERLWLKIPFGKSRHKLSTVELKKILSEKDIQVVRERLRELGYGDV